MNVSYETGRYSLFWLDFEHNVAEWKRQDNFPIPVGDVSNKCVPNNEKELNVDYYIQYSLTYSITFNRL